MGFGGSENCQVSTFSGQVKHPSYYWPLIPSFSTTPSITSYLQDGSTLGVFVRAPKSSYNHALVISRIYFSQWINFRTLLWVQQVEQFFVWQVFTQNLFLCKSLVQIDSGSQTGMVRFSPWRSGFSLCFLAGLNYTQNWQVGSEEFSNELFFPFFACLLRTSNCAECCGEYPEEHGEG